MICNNCGANNNQEAKFCQSCGRSLETNSTRDIKQVSRRNIPGDLIISSRFKIIKQLGKGGMGEISLAEDVKLKRKVAVKSILTEVLTDPTSKSRFLREAQTASQLDHPNICTIYEIYEQDDNGYIIMQYIDGITLDQIIKLEKLSLGKILDIGIQVCAGMIEAECKKIIHRDIKPGNIMVDKKGTVKILDFGLAKIGDKSMVRQDGMVDSNLTEKGIVLGTVAYISPEQAKGQALDQRTDVFSFGVVLYEMMEGKNPFQVEEQIETLYNVLNKRVEFSRDFPAELKQIVLKCLEKDREKRYDDFSQLKHELERFRDHYLELKKGTAGFDQTEKIDFLEQQLLQKEIQKSTDKEDLGDIVYRIKKLNASTQPILSTKRHKIKYFLLPAILIVIAVLGYIFLNQRGDAPLVEHDQKFYVYLHDFQNGTAERDLAQKINYLLSESLNQFDQFKTINKEAVLPLSKNSNPEENLAFLKDRFNIEHELKGSITQAQGFFNIDARLISYKKGGKESQGTFVEKTITSTGQDLDSFLVSQVDTVAAGVFHRFFAGQGKELQLKKMSRIYGVDWKSFSDFYRGYGHYKRLESDKAETYLLKAGDLLLARYILAEVYNFNGERLKAAARLNEIMPHIDRLTGRQQLKVQALKARLEFNFQQEIKHLEELKNNFPFSKEVFYALGEAYFHYRDTEKAIPYYERALELDKNFTLAINHLAYCHTFMGNHGQAIPLFEDYKNLDRTANSFDSLGDGYFYAGDLVNAEAFKKRSIAMDERSVTYSYITLAEIYILKAEYEKARQALERYHVLIDTPEARARAAAVQAFIFYENREYEKALAVVDRSLALLDSDSINNQTGEAHWLKGLILLALNNAADSKKELAWLQEFKEKYHLTRDNFFKPYKYLLHLHALILEKDNKINEADETFKFLLEMKNKLSFWTYFNYQFFHTEYARFLNRNKVSGLALEEIDKCLEFNQNYIPALWAKAEILENLKDKARFAVYPKILELYGQSDERNYWRNLLLKK